MTPSTEIRERFDRWWKHEDFGRPLAKVVGRHSPLRAVRAESPRAFHFDPKVRVEIAAEQAENCNFYADAFPFVDLNLGPGSLAAYHGCEPAFSFDTVWYEPMNVSELSELDGCFDARTKWWNLHLAAVREAVGLAVGRFPVCIPDVQENLDILSAMRGPEQLCFDLIDEPETVKGLLAQVETAWAKSFEEMYQAVKDERGASAFTVFSVFGGGRTSKLQCDFSALISPDDFDEFVIPSLRRQCEALDNTLYHLDGKDAIRHVDSLMKLEKLQALQWTSGAGQQDGGAEEWFPLYDKVIGAGKSLWIAIYDGCVDSWLERAKRILKRYGTRGIYFVFGDTSDEDARKIVKELKL